MGDLHSMHRMFRRMFVLSAVMTVVGCNSLAERDPKLYRAMLDGPHSRNTPRYATGEPLTLQRALAVADADNEAIASSGENYIQALADKLRDAGTFLPTISVAPTYSLSHGGEGGFLIGETGTTGSSGTSTGGTTTTGGSGSSGNLQFTSGKAGVSHNFSIPLGATATGSLANVSTYKAAGQTAAQRAMLLLDEREAILLQVAQSYYTTLTDEHQIVVYESSVKFKQEKVRDQQARLKLGAVRPLDVAQSESDLAASQVSLTQARTDAANGRSALARLMGVDEVTGPLDDSFTVPDDTLTLEHWRSLALANRQDLQAAQRAVDSSRYKIEAAIREYLPSVTINFDYFLYHDPSSSQRWSGGLSGNIPIFSALAIEADVRAAWSEYRQAGLSLSQTRHQAIDDVNEGYRNVQNSREKVAELEIETAAARKAADLAERAYHLGSESNLDRLTQQDNFITAQLTLVSEQYTEKSSYMSLLRAAGALASAMR